MLKLNTSKQSTIAVFNASQLDSEPVRRFIVPVINPEADLTTVAQRVWELANATGARVQFLGLCSDAMHEPGFRRVLATTSAMVNYGNVSAESEIVMGRDWVKSMRSRLREGDTVICQGEQHMELLHTDLGVPVHFIPERKPTKTSNTNWLTRTAAWLGSIAIIVFFFFIQVEIDHFAKGWVTVLQLLSVAGEFWLVWLWNSLLE